MKYVERLPDEQGFVLRCGVGILAKGDTIENFVQDIFDNQESDNIHTGVPHEDSQQGRFNEKEHTLFWSLYHQKQKEYDRK